VRWAARDALDGHPARLWPVQPADHTNPWLEPETFAFALALQNLMWGASQPITGALADRSAPCASCSSAWRSMWPGWSSWTGHQRHRLATGAGVLIGIAQSGTTYSVVYGVIGRVASAEKRAGPWASRQRPGRSASS
jgi:hypothetical protein